MTRPGTLAWFARHEIRLAWRDFISMITAGRRRRTIGIVIGFVIFGAGLLHAVITAPNGIAGQIMDLAAGLRARFGKGGKP